MADEFKLKLGTVLAKLAHNANRSLLLVEGQLDADYFASVGFDSRDVVKMGGSSQVSRAHQELSLNIVSSGRFCAVRDCDYEVCSGAVDPTEDLIVTERADLDADLFNDESVTRILSAHGLRVPPAEIDALIPQVWAAAIGFGRLKAWSSQNGFQLAHRSANTFEHCVILEGPSGLEIEPDFGAWLREVISKKPVAGFDSAEAIAGASLMRLDRKYASHPDLWGILQWSVRDRLSRPLGERSFQSSIRALCAFYPELQVLERVRSWESSSARRVRRATQ